MGPNTTNSTKEKVNLIQAWFANPSDYPRGGHPMAHQLRQLFHPGHMAG
jgi:hypothetical protein